MNFVLFLEAAQDGDGVLDRGLFDHDGLEPSLEGRVFFDITLVFADGRRADGVKFSAGQGRFQEI